MDKNKYELQKIDKRIIEIKNILASPLSNGLSWAEEKSLRAERTFLFLKKEKIYKDLIMQIEDLQKETDEFIQEMEEEYADKM